MDRYVQSKRKLVLLKMRIRKAEERKRLEELARIARRKLLKKISICFLVTASALVVGYLCY